MVFNATFNNSSAVSWRSVLLVVETRVSGENHRPVASHWQTYHICCIEYTSPWTGFEFTAEVVGYPTTIRSGSIPELSEKKWKKKGNMKWKYLNIWTRKKCMSLFILTVYWRIPAASYSALVSNMKVKWRSSPNTMSKHDNSLLRG